jgi:hypothetical protein
LSRLSVLVGCGGSAALSGDNWWGCGILGRWARRIGPVGRWDVLLAAGGGQERAADQLA